MLTKISTKTSTAAGMLTVVATEAGIEAAVIEVPIEVATEAPAAVHPDKSGSRIRASELQAVALLPPEMLAVGAADKRVRAIAPPVAPVRERDLPPVRQGRAPQPDQ